MQHAPCNARPGLTQHSSQQETREVTTSSRMRALLLNPMPHALRAALEWHGLRLGCIAFPSFYSALHTRSKRRTPSVHPLQIMLQVGLSKDDHCHKDGCRTAGTLQASSSGEKLHGNYTPGLRHCTDALLREYRRLCLHLLCRAMRTVHALHVLALHALLALRALRVLTS